MSVMGNLKKRRCTVVCYNTCLFTVHRVPGQAKTRQKFENVIACLIQVYKVCSEGFKALKHLYNCKKNQAGYFADFAYCWLFLECNSCDKQGTTITPLPGKRAMEQFHLKSNSQSPTSTETSHTPTSLCGNVQISDVSQLLAPISSPDGLLWHPPCRASVSDSIQVILTIVIKYYVAVVKIYNVLMLWDSRCWWKWSLMTTLLYWYILFF